MSFKRRYLKLLVLVSILMPFFNCSRNSTIDDNHFEHKSGIYFEFPAGWSRLTREEWEQRNMGTNQTLITIADKAREAFFAVIPMEFDITALEVKFLSMGKRMSATEMLIEALHRAGPMQYLGYKMIDKGTVDFAGWEVGELIFEGKQMKRRQTWNQIIIAVDKNKSNKYYMLVFSLPPKKLIFYEKDLEVIDRTWRWPE